MPNAFLDGLQRPAILQNNSGLPDYSSANDGDALIIDNGEPTWGAVDALPEIEETDEGKVLAVDQGEAVWADAPSGGGDIPVIYYEVSSDPDTGATTFTRDTSDVDTTAILSTNSMVFIGVYSGSSPSPELTSTFKLCKIVSSEMGNVAVYACDVSGVYVLGRFGSGVDAIACFGQLGMADGVIQESYVVVDHDITPAV